MKVPKTDKFLFFFRLEIGGYAIAGVSVLFSLGFLTFFSVSITQILIAFNLMDEGDRNFFSNIITVLSIIYAITAVYFSILFIAAVFLILGTFYEKHNFMILHQIVTSVFVIASFALLFQIPIAAFIPSMIFAIIGIYFFICIHSLYSSIKDKSTLTAVNMNNGEEHVTLRVQR